MPPIETVGQIYIRIVGITYANIQQLGKCPSSLVAIKLDGIENSNLKTSVSYDSNPQYHQEFFMTTSNEKSVISFELYDYRVVLSNIHLARSQEIRCDQLAKGLNHMKLTLDIQTPSVSSKCELECYIQYTPFESSIPAKSTIAQELSWFRIVTDSYYVYPGSVVRGAVIVRETKPRQTRGLRLTIDGRTSTYWSSGSKNQKHYFANQILFNSTIVLFGNSKDSKEKPVSTIPGAYVYPFIFTLPDHLPPSFGHSYGRAVYTIKAYFDIPWGFDKLVEKELKVLSFFPSLSVNDTLDSLSTVAKSFVSDDQNVQIALSGPINGFVGENYMVNANVVNNGTKDLVSLSVSLLLESWHCGYLDGNLKLMTRASDFLKSVASGEFTDIPGWPLKPGQSWTGQLAIRIPSDCVVSLHSSFSPLVQTDYRISVVAKTSGNLLTKSRAINWYSIVVANRNPGHEMIPVPIPNPNAAHGLIFTTEATPAFYSALVPKYNTPEGFDIEKCISDIDPALFATISGPVQHLNETATRAAVPKESWKMGDIPSWIDVEGLNPRKEIVKPPEPIDQGFVVVSSSGTGTESFETPLI